MNSLDLAQVAIYRLKSPTYPRRPPFHPSESYPEYRGELEKTEANLVYEAVRESLRLLKLDEVHYGTSEWNPLGDIVRPGDRIVLKPNFLAESHTFRRDEWVQIITHGSVIRAVLDYVLLALKGQGEVWIVDGPQYDSNWRMILERTGTQSVVDYCASRTSVPIRLVDLRDYQQVMRGDVILHRVPLPSDPQGGVEIDLADQSMFVGHNGAGRYYGSDYDQEETNRHHSDGRHEYRISRTAASAEVFINLPKLKTHKKVGVTLCLKNLVGINVGRNWLPHYTDGDPSNGGDQFPTPSAKSKLERAIVRWMQRQSLHSPIFGHLYRVGKVFGKRIFGRTDQVIRHGNWYGNDTAWRMVLDINRCLMYSDGESFPTALPKRFFAVVDGVIGGDGNGPDCADAYPAGIVIAGCNPVAVDCVAARLMGFDPRRIPQLWNAFRPHPLPLVDFPYEAIRLASNEPLWNGSLSHIPSDSTFRFRPHFGWVGHIEWT